MNLSQNLHNNKSLRKQSQSISGAELECSNIKGLAPEVVKALDDWMATRFKSYIWLTSEKEADVDFVIARLNGEMIGRSAVVTREALLNNKPIMIMGIAGVIVEEEYQKRGLGHELMQESMRFVEKSAVEFCILMCNRELGALYSEFGFKEVPGQNAFFAQPDGSRHEYKPEHGITMVYSKNGKLWPGGNLDLNGLPF